MQDEGVGCITTLILHLPATVSSRYFIYNSMTIGYDDLFVVIVIVVVAVLS